MEYAYLGRTGLKVSNLWLGCMQFGGAASTQCSEDEAFKILDAYVAAGGNVLDTADVYSGGESERIVGRWLKKNASLRSKIVIATKARGAVDPQTAGPNDVGLSRAHLTQALADSLARLQVDYIDIYQCHIWDDGTPLEETLRTLDDFVRSGKIRYWGYSNTTGYQLQKIVETVKRLGLSPCASLQQQYSLLSRHTELEVTEVCENEGVALLPWSPLKGGWLSGKIKREGGAPEGSRVGWAQSTGAKMQSHPSYDAYATNDKVWALLDAMAEIAKARGGSVAQVALRWLLQKRVTTAIVIGAKNVEQLHDNIACSKVKLTDEDMAQLDALSFAANFGDALPYPYEMVTRLNVARRRPIGK